MFRDYRDGTPTETIKIIGFNQIQRLEDYTNLPETKQMTNGRVSWIGYQQIPCGQCWSCRLKKSAEWATRAALETREFEHNWFITLTYDNEHLPTTDYMVDEETGEFYKNDGTWNGYLVPEHFKKFMKDLRRYYKYHYDWDGIRFLMCGEYGEKKGRPHYHAIIFNLPLFKDGENKLTDERALKPSKYKAMKGMAYWDSELIERIWGRGQTIVADVNWSTCAYVARYVMKKQTGKAGAEAYAAQGKTPVYANMSRRPGIGRNYYDDHRDEIYENDEIIMKTVKGNVGSRKPPTYYDKLYDLEEPEKMADIKEQRKKAAANAMEIKLAQTTNTMKEQMHIDEKSIVMKTAALIRPLES